MELGLYELLSFDNPRLHVIFLALLHDNGANVANNVHVSLGVLQLLCT